MGRKYRRCPHCKNKDGFSIHVSLGGAIDVKSNFRSKIIDSEKRPCDTIDKYATCLNCGKGIDAEKLDLSNV